MSKKNTICAGKENGSLSQWIFKLAAFSVGSAALVDVGMAIYGLFKDVGYEPFMNILTFGYGLLAFAVGYRYLCEDAIPNDNESKV